MNIDLTKLSRDYTSIPLVRGYSSRYKCQRGEIPCYNDIYYLYIQCNLSIIELGKFFGRKKDSALFWVSYHNIKKSRELIENKMADTKLKVYGDKNYNNISQALATRLIKYGNMDGGSGAKVREFFKNASFEEKATVINKRKQTCLEKFGYDNYMKNPENRAKFLSKISHRPSKPELELAAWFSTNNIEYITQYVIKHKEHTKIYDFFLPKYNTLIEYDGDYWHRLENQIANDKLKNQISSELGYRLVRIKGKAKLNESWEIQ